MKRLLFIFIVLVCLQSFAQAPSWAWAQRAGGSANADVALNCASDASGNTYVTGYFRAGSATFGTYTLTNGTAGKGEFFLAKYDPNGNVLWAKSASGSDDDQGASVALDNSGGVYVTGMFASPSINFGATTLNNDSSATGDIFIAKYDASGNFQWALSAGGKQHDYGNSVTSDGTNIYFGGSFSSTSITIGGTTLTNSDPVYHTTDIFLARLDASGNVSWARSPAGNSMDELINVRADASGNFLATGYYASFGLNFGSHSITSAGNQNGFLVKYDANGNDQWAATAGGWSAPDAGHAVATNASGDVYWAGIFSSSVFKIGTDSLTCAGPYDIFIAKFNQSGTYQWVRQFGSSGDDVVKNLVLDANSNLYFTGKTGSATLAIGTTTLTSNGGYDIYVAKCDANGNGVWAVNVGGAVDESGNGIALGATNDLCIAGNFRSSPLTFGTYTVATAGNTDIFVAKLSGVMGINNLTTNEEVKVYPNPCNGIFNIRSAFEITEVEIVNVLGETVFSKTVNQKDLALNVAGQKPGLYFYRLKGAGNKYSTGKIIIE